VKNPTNVQDKYCKMEIVESIICGQFEYPIIEGMFTLHKQIKWKKNLHGCKFYYDSFEMVY